MPRREILSSAPPMQQRMFCNYETIKAFGEVPSRREILSCYLLPIAILFATLRFSRIAMGMLYFKLPKIASYALHSLLFAYHIFFFTSGTRKAAIEVSSVDRNITLRRREIQIEDSTAMAQFSNIENKMSRASAS